MRMTIDEPPVDDDDEACETDAAHPRIRERREAVEGARLRKRSRRLVVLGVTVLLALVGYGITQSPLLDVDEVRVIGADLTGPNTIRAVADVEPGTPLLGLDLEPAERRLLDLPSIASVASARTWSGVVTFEVVERAPAARIDTVDGTIVVAGDGIVIDLTDTPDDTLPIISGAMFRSSPGELVPNEVFEALTVADALPADIARVTERVELSIDNLVLRLRGGGAVVLGDARQLEEKFDAVRAFLAGVNLQCLGELDVQAPLVPVVTRDGVC